MVTGGWWRHFELAAGQAQNIQIGPARLSLIHLEREWRVAVTRVDESSSTNVDQVFSVSPSIPAATASIDVAGFIRYASRRTVQGFRLEPGMADRPVVCKPLNPLFVLPGDQVELFVATPAWIRVFVNSSTDVDGISACEVPALALTDTWIGSSTVEGELGYSTRTKARLSYADVPLRPHLVITGVVVRNLSAEVLHLERLSLPAPYLGVFSSANNALCTEGIILEHKDPRQFAGLEIMREPLGPVGACKRISSPRIRSEDQGTVIRAFGSLLTQITGGV